MLPLVLNWFAIIKATPLRFPKYVRIALFNARDGFCF
jgi:hypothetical protein